MRRLVALAMPGGPLFEQALRRCWDDGDAALPLDWRLSKVSAERVLEAMGPAVVVDSSGAERTRRGARPVEEGDAVVVATSGTTGESKGVVLTHKAVAASALATSARLGVDSSRDRWLACLPLSHVGGLSVVTRAIVTATPLEIQPHFVVDKTLEAAIERGATLVSLVPAALSRLGPPGAARFRKIVLGGQQPPTGLPANAVTTYGMTETGSGVVYDGVPLDGVEVRIVEGEILLRAPMLLRCYRDGTDPITPGGWFPTGDAGEIDEAGRLVVRGRLDDLVISGGENIWPAQVETALRAHPAIAEVAVAGMPDPEWGARLVAYVVANGDDDRDGASLLAELRELVREQIAPYAAPRELVLVDALPYNAIGKVARAELAGLEGLRVLAS